jgi:hypothetical protein
MAFFSRKVTVSPTEKSDWSSLSSPSGVDCATAAPLPGGGAFGGVDAGGLFGS